MRAMNWRMRGYSFKCMSCLVGYSIVMLGFFNQALAEPRVILDQLEAYVNNSIIRTSDVQKFKNVEKLRAQLDPLFAGTPLAAQGKQASKAEIVEFLINERLITQQFPKTDAEVEQEINSIQANNRLDRNALKEALAKEGYNFSDYFELIRDSGSKRDLIDRDIRTKVSISDDDVKNYFYNHYARSENAPRAFHIQMITVSEKSYKAKSNTTAKALASKVANQALKDISAGEFFEEVAKRVSDDSSASSGGDLGVLSEDQISPLIRENVKKLKIGEVSPIFKDEKSSRYYILKLLDVKSADTERLEKVKEDIRGQLAAKEYQHQISLWLERQQQSAFIHRIGEPSIKGMPLTK